MTKTVKFDEIEFEIRRIKILILRTSTSTYTYIANIYAVYWNELVSQLVFSGEFTVFAPTNQAFERLPATTLSYLSSNTQALADVLKYHVVSGTVMKSAASNELQVTSLAGSKIRFNIYPFNGMVNWFLKNNCLQF